MRLSTETPLINADSPGAAPRVGIVIGPPRSGTTLLGTMLGRASGVLSLSEPLLAYSIFGNWRRRKFLRRMIREGGLQPARPPARPNESEFVDWLVARAHSSQRAAVVIKETYRGGMPWPAWNNAAQVERLLARRFGESSPPLVAIVRHPYAVAASTIRLCRPLLAYCGWQGFFVRLVWPVLPKLRGADEVVRAAARNWAACADWLKRHDPPLVRYEELVANPRGEISRVCVALGVSCDDAMFEPGGLPGRAVGLGDSDVLYGPARPVDPASLSRGDDLTVTQRAIVRDACADAAGQFGYELA